VPNTAEGDFENSVKSNPPWRKLKLASEHALPATGDTVLRLAYDDAWNAGYRAGETAEVRRATEDRTRYV
jgi:hypothetical protein